MMLIFKTFQVCINSLENILPKVSGRKNREKIYSFMNYDQIFGVYHTKVQASV